MPQATAAQGAKRKAARVMVAAGASARAPEQERSLRPRQSQRQRTNIDFVNLEDFDWSDQEQEAALEEGALDVGLVDDDLLAVAAGEPEGDIDIPGGHVDYEVETILNERGSAASGDREFLVLWKRWPRPTWQALELP